MAESAISFYARAFDLADPYLLRSLDVAALEAEAAIRRDESAAASDLALSLRQGATLRDTLRRWRSFDVTVDGTTFRPCVEVGNDYVRVAADVPTLVPLGAVALVRASGGAPPRVVDRQLLFLLRSAARRSGVVELETIRGATRLQGTLVQASGDHVVVRTKDGEAGVPLRSLRVVRLPSAEGGDPGAAR